MTRFFRIFVLSVACFGSALAADLSGVSFDLTGVHIGRVVNLVYGEALPQNYVIAPEVLADDRLVSFRYRPGPGAVPFRVFFVDFLESLGYTVVTRGNIDFIGKTPVVEPKALPFVTVVYRPRYRDAGYLRRVIDPLLLRRDDVPAPLKPGPLSALSALSGVAPALPMSAAPASSGVALPASGDATDVIVYRLPSGDAAMVQNLLFDLDVDPGQLVIRAIVYEVSSTKSDGSALQLLGSVLGGHLGVSINAGAALTNALSLRVGDIDAVISALSVDNRFHAVTQPRLRVRSGDVARLVVGQDVPVIGGTSYQNGVPLRSVEYRSAGTILTVKPTIRGDAVLLDVQQQLSSSQRTDTGVDESPTLIKRDLQTSISALPGEVIVLGGLTESRKSNTRRGLSFLPWALSASDDGGSTDVLVVLSLDRL